MTISPHSRRTGFSFAEVMFAVVILGIGFIMVAAVFPVAIQQTQATDDENLAAMLARQAANAVSRLPSTIPNPIYGADSSTIPSPATTIKTELLFPPTVKNYVKGMDVNAPNAPSIVVPFVGNRWDLIKGNVLLPSDPRYGYSMFYKRDANSSVAQLIVIAMKVRNRSKYDDSINHQDTNNYPYQSSQSIASTTPGDFSAFASQPQHTVICPDVINGPVYPGTAEGSYVQIPNTTVTKTAATPPPVGRSYTLGRCVNSLSAWEMMPGDSMALTAGTGSFGASGWGTAGPIDDPSIAVPQIGYLRTSATMQPTVAYAILSSSPASPSGRIVLYSGVANTFSGGGMVGPPINAAPGAFVIIADDFPSLPAMQASGGGLADYSLQPNIPNAGQKTYVVGSMNGRIFRLGTAVPADPTNQTAVVPAGTFNLDPAYGMQPIPPVDTTTPTSVDGPIIGPFSPDTLPNPNMLNHAFTVHDPDYATALSLYGCVKVYIIGVGRTDPTATGSNAAYSGTAQDIGAYVSYFQVQ